MCKTSNILRPQTHSTCTVAMEDDKQSFRGLSEWLLGVSFHLVWIEELHQHICALNGCVTGLGNSKLDQGSE